MKQYRKYLCGVGAVLVLGLVEVPAAWASEFSAVVWPAEGNVTCSDYSANKIILSMGSSSIVDGSSGNQLTGPANPQDGDGNTTNETAQYSISADGTTASFTSSTPINYVVLKSSKDVSVVIYKTGGVQADNDMTITRNGTNEPIQAISLCYGLPGQQPPPPAPVASCSSQGVSVPGTDPQLVYRFDLANNGSYNPVACTTGNVSAVKCNPKLPAGVAGSCFPATTTTLPPKQVVTNIELNNDPYYCATYQGTTDCYYYSYP